MPRNRSADSVYELPHFKNSANVPEYNEPRAIPVTESSIKNADFDYLPEDKEIKPIPVKVVEVPETRGTQRIRGFVAGRGYCDSTDNPQRVAPRDDQRTKLRVRVLTTSDPTEFAYIGHDSNVNSLSGFPVYQGDIVEIESSREVWAVASKGSPINIAWISEQSIPVL